jgi:dipeptidyl aminopeptidase/acylaminoacyl peptidase
MIGESRTRRWTGYRTLAVVLLALSSSVTLPVSGVIPVEDLFATPQMMSPKLSPDGRRLALIYRARIGSEVALMVIDLETMESETLAVAEFNDHINRYQWVSDDTIIYDFSSSDYFDSGNDLRLTRFEDPSTDGTRHYSLTRDFGRIFNVADQIRTSPPRFKLLDRLPDSPDEVLITVTGIPRLGLPPLVGTRTEEQRRSRELVEILDGPVGRKVGERPVERTADEDASAGDTADPDPDPDPDADVVDPEALKAVAEEGYIRSRLGLDLGLESALDEDEDEAAGQGQGQDEVQTAAPDARDEVEVVLYEAPETCEEIDEVEARIRERLGETRRSTRRILDPLIERMLEDLRHAPIYPHVVRMDLWNGDIDLVAVNPGRVTQWIVDPDGQPRLGVTLECDLSKQIVFQQRDSDLWETLETIPFGGEVFQPLAFDDTGDRIYVLTDRDRSTAALQLYDPMTRTIQEVVFGLDEFDVSSVQFAEAEHRPVSVRYSDGVPQEAYLDLYMIDIAGLLQRSLPDRALQLTRSDDGMRFLVQARGDQEPGMYYLFDRPGFELREVLAANEWLDGQQFARMQPIQVVARDGTELQGYLTEPREGSRPFPTVIMVHGGPFGVRDDWGFNPEAQFLADRGYAVVQVNFRGSAGYGREFAHAGWRQWGETIQDDIADGTRWAIQDGVADPEQICIYGGSFGGYAALMNVIRYPDLYQCAVSWAGVTDLVALVDEQSVSQYRRRWHRFVTGDLESDSETLSILSPVNRAADISVPVFIAHGEQDAVVDVEQGHRMVEALRDAGRPGRALFQSLSGHHMSNETQRIQFFDELETFLARYIGTTRSGDRGVEEDQ